MLVLGSFPGAESLRRKQYYAHPRNLFWRLVGDVLEVDLCALPYRERLRTLRAHHVGLWDIYASCTRVTSADARIRDATMQDFTTLRRRCPRLERVRCNGVTAARAVGALERLGYRVTVLPSSSPAHASRPYAEKLRAWRRALGTRPLGNRRTRRTRRAVPV